MIMEGLAHHAARELPKALPGVAVVAVSSWLSLPWQQIGYFLGCVLIVVQGAYTIAKWTQERRDARKIAPKPTVPPASGA